MVAGDPSVREAQPGNPSRRARCDHERGTQVYVVVRCGDIAYSCDAECLFWL
jgi:hypothetical protein